LVMKAASIESALVSDIQKNLYPFLKDFDFPRACYVSECALRDLCEVHGLSPSLEENPWLFVEFSLQNKIVGSGGCECTLTTALHSLPLTSLDDNTLYMTSFVMHHAGLFAHRIKADMFEVEIKDCYLVKREELPVVVHIALSPVSNYYRNEDKQEEDDKDNKDDKKDSFESLSFQHFFSKPRYVDKGHLLCIPIVKGSHADMTINSNGNGNDTGNMGVTFQWYLVKDVRIKGDYESIGRHPPCMTSPQVTQVVLFQSQIHVCRQWPHLQHSCFEALSDMLLTDKTANTTTMGSILDLALQYMSQWIQTQKIQNGDVMRLKQQDRILSLLSPCLEIARDTMAFTSNVSTQVKQTLLSNPVMLTSTNILDMRSILGHCAQSLGLSLYILDARFLWQYASKRKQGVDPSTSIGLYNKSCFSSEAYGGSYIYADSSDVDKILQASPCLLYIEGLDTFLKDITVLDGVMHNGGEDDSSPQSKYAKDLRLFLEELYQHSTTDTDTTVLFGESKSGAIVTVSHVSSLHLLEGPMRAVFPREGPVLCEEDVHLDDLTREWAVEGDEEMDSSGGKQQPLMERAVESLARELAMRQGYRLGEGQREGRLVESWCRLIRKLGYQKLLQERGQLWHSTQNHTQKNLSTLIQDFASNKNNEDSRMSYASNKDVQSAITVISTEYSRSTRIKGDKNSAADTLQSQNIAPVYWKDIGGLDKVRQEILNMIQLPMERPELFPPGCPIRRAVLLYGPPGTGKTLVAKAVATECQMNFLSVKGPELLDVYVGESERNVREVFSNARELSPCVLFFDELDSLAPARGRGADGGGVMDRVVAQFLVEMDSLSANENESRAGQGVIVLAATNRPDLLDPALLRPGRFDRKVYLSVCRDVASRQAILHATTRKLKLSRDANLALVAVNLPNTVTGADIGSVVSEAFRIAQERTLEALKEEGRNALYEQGKDLQAGSDAEEWAIAAYMNRLPKHRLEVYISGQDLAQATELLRPSVSPQELQHYERLAAQYSDVINEEIM